jgi:divalent metal cation (Fe/Co/Zn/Cd) transporter
MVVAVLAAVGGAFLVEFLLTVRPDRPFGHTRSGRMTGWAAVACLLLVFGYSIRKRWGRDRRWSKGWFRVHMGAGVLGTVVALVHSGAHFHALTPILTMIVLLIITLSGIVGQALHYPAVRMLHDRRHELLDQGVDEGEVEARLHVLAAREEVIRSWQYLHAPLTVVFAVLLLLHIAGSVYFGGW